MTLYEIKKKILETGGSIVVSASEKLTVAELNTLLGEVEYNDGSKDCFTCPHITKPFKVPADYSFTLTKDSFDYEDKGILWAINGFKTIKFIDIDYNADIYTDVLDEMMNMISGD